MNNEKKCIHYEFEKNKKIIVIYLNPEMNKRNTLFTGDNTINYQGNIIKGHIYPF